MKTLKFNFLAMTVLTMCCFMVLESCRKEPIDDKDGGWCGTVDPKCNTLGTVAYLPTQCLNSVMSDVLGIRDDAGKYYLIGTDKTGSFSDFTEGDRVKFGFETNAKECTICCFACDCPRGDYCVTLTCISSSNKNQKPDCGFGECSTPAKVVSYTHSGSEYESVGNLIQIGGKHYKVIGNASQDIENMQNGREIFVSHNEAITDCYLPAVITTPRIDGCVELTCINEKLILRTN